MNEWFDKHIAEIKQRGEQAQRELAPFEGPGVWLSLIGFLVIAGVMFYSLFWPFYAFAEARDWILDSRHKIMIPASYAAEFNDEEMKLLATAYWEIRKAELFIGHNNREANKRLEAINTALKIKERGVGDEL